LLGISSAVVVLTKVDLTSLDRIATTANDVQQLISGSPFQGAPIVKVSAKTGEGLELLRAQLARLTGGRNALANRSFARLPIDRSFALKGFGTVVTGTLGSGTLRTGDVVQIHGTGKEARIRGLQVHGSSVEEAHAGERTAVNLAGVDYTEIRRGFTLTSKSEVEPIIMFDGVAEWLNPENAPATRKPVFIHIGTAEIPAEMKLVMPGHPFIRVWLSEPVLALAGDRFIIRRPSPAETLGGGSVIDTFAKKRMNRTRILAGLNALSGPNALEYLVEESKTGVSLSDLVRRTGEEASEIKSAIAVHDALTFAETSQRAFSKKLLEQKRRELIQWLAHFHAANPAAAGAPVSQARRNFDPAVAEAILANDPTFVTRGDLIALAAHKVRISQSEMDALASLENTFREAAFAPPLVNEVLKRVDADGKKARDLLEALIKSGRLVRLSPDLVYHADVVAHIRQSLAAHKGRKFSVPEFKDWTQISRKYAIPLLEYLDRVHVTRREGDSRVVL
jgi:selenocysteine-specific elongation factor